MEMLGLWLKILHLHRGLLILILLLTVTIPTLFEQLHGMTM